MGTDTSSVTLSFNLLSSAGSQAAQFSISETVIAGWTGRDSEGVEKHIRELEKLGIQRPASTPIFYRVAAVRLTTAGEIQVVGEKTSGEVEVVLLQLDGQLWVGVGSDHTDREVETYGVTVSKQVCDKPVAPDLWPYAEVVEHWDQLALRSYALMGNKRELYQEGTVASLLPPTDLIARYTQGASLPDGTLMFGGTLATLGDVQPSRRFEFELEDPVLKRRITHGYDIRTLPILG